MQTKTDGRLTIRIDLTGGARLGPGKVALLEAIGATGSISGGARSMKMSYQRAWDLTESLNRDFGAKMVETSTGGHKGGGARLTDRGMELVKHYRNLEAAAYRAAVPHLAAICQMAEAAG